MQTCSFNGNLGCNCSGIQEKQLLDLICVGIYLLFVQSLSCVQLFATPQTAARQTSLSFTISQSLLWFMSIELVMPSNHCIHCHPFLPLPSVFPSPRVFSNESALCIRWPKYQSFSISTSPSNENSRLISFRIDWFDILVFHGTLKSLLQHHSWGLWRRYYFKRYGSLIFMED